MADFQPFIDQILESFRMSGDEFINQVQADQRPRVELALTRLGESTAQLLADPANREVYQRDINHLLNTLQSELAVTGFRADNAARRLIGNIIRQSIGFLLAAV